MSGRTIGKKCYPKKILQMLHHSGSEEKNYLSQDVYIPSDERESTSSYGCFTEIAQNNLSSESENKENSSMNIDSQHANTSRKRSQSRNKKMTKSQDLTSLSQNEHSEEVAKDGKVWTTAPSDIVSLGRLQQQNVLEKCLKQAHLPLGSM
ncbi:hypothetical protein AVEN_226953-1 [Araneus ventricosus]|uniref:Uncharacterized protein n=1 Tax=Araneus ventricosus TaxID=182803 RepID=A0A4Y2LG12_ARAVE|nr:hypothetical protein AVEN_226953-1 [Araneus ventricosus]